jgi:hypothetical protein
MSTNGLEPLLLAESDLETDALTNSARWTEVESVGRGIYNLQTDKDS